MATFIREEYLFHSRERDQQLLNPLRPRRRSFAILCPVRQGDGVSSRVFEPGSDQIFQLQY